MEMIRRLILFAVSFAVGGWLAYHPRSQPRTQASQQLSAAGGDVLTGASRIAVPSDSDVRFSRLASALQERQFLKQRYELYEAASQLTVEELRDQISRAEKLSPNYRGPLLTALIGRWFELDAAAAAEWVRNHKANSDILLAWAHCDPESVLADVMSSRSSRWKAEILQAAVEELVGPNVADQAARLATLPQGPERDRALWSRIVKWSKDDPVAAFQFASGLPSGPLRDQSLQSTLAASTSKDPDAAMARVNEILLDLKGSEWIVQVLVNGVAGRDPKAALQFARQLPKEFGTDAVVVAARAWARNEPEAALDWCRSNGIEIARTMQRNGIYSSAGVLGEAMRSHPNETIAWIEALPPGRERERLIERSLHERLDYLQPDQLFNNGEDIVLDLYRKLAPEAQERTAADLGRVIGTRDDFSDLRQWADRFEPGAARNAAVSSAMAAALTRNGARAETMLSGLANSSDRDAALSGIVRSLAGNSPADAAGRALEIEDAILRREALDDLIPDWLHRDPEISRAWLRQASALPGQWINEWEQKARGTR
jgi:hypothetical protein